VGEGIQIFVSCLKLCSTLTQGFFRPMALQRNGIEGCQSFNQG
jgi:hypothetical protein